MLHGENILSLFGQHVSITRLEETLDRYTADAVCNGPVLAVRTALPELLQEKGFGDHLVITATVGEDTLSFDSQKNDNGLFFTSWESYQLQADAEDKIELVIIIEKEIHEGNALFVYDKRSFFEYLQKLSPIELMAVFSGQFKLVGSTVFFINPDFGGGAHTQSIYFIAEMAMKYTIVSPDIDREKSWEKVNTVSHINGIGDCVVLPEDFAILEAGCIPDEVQQGFRKTCLILILGILYDFTTVQGDRIFLKLNGYKTFQVDVQIKDIKLISLDVYYQIYCWVIAGGNMQDKIGLSRNLISLNIDPADNYTVIPSVYTSILSGFKVYEKQNIKQYIELRNKMSDQLIGFNEKAGKIVDSFAGSFQKSALAVVSLYASFIVTRVLSTHEFENVFSVDATILSFAFLAASLLYFFVSRWEISQQKKRFIESYQDMKSRNEDLLTREDIEKILKNDAEHGKDVKFIEDKQNSYSALWIGFLVIFTIATLILSQTYHPLAPKPTIPGTDSASVVPRKGSAILPASKVDTTSIADTSAKSRHGAAKNGHH